MKNLFQLKLYIISRFSSGNYLFRSCWVESLYTHLTADRGFPRRACSQGAPPSGAAASVSQPPPIRLGGSPRLPIHTCPTRQQARSPYFSEDWDQ